MLLDADDYNPPESPLDELVRREVQSAFSGDEQMLLLSMDEDERGAFVESRVASVTGALITRLGLDEVGLQAELEERVAALLGRRSAEAAAAYDGDLEGLREG
jgi:hypothetical protein